MTYLQVSLLSLKNSKCKQYFLREKRIVYFITGFLSILADIDTLTLLALILKIVKMEVSQTNRRRKEHYIQLSIVSLSLILLYSNDKTTNSGLRSRVVPVVIFNFNSSFANIQKQFCAVVRNDSYASYTANFRKAKPIPRILYV